jgi:signal transduction histidine kinase
MAAHLSAAWFGAALALTAVAGALAGRDGAGAAALVLLGVIGSGIAVWTWRRTPVLPPPADLRRVKEEFLATVSHELRTPLNVILGWTELLRRPRVGPPAQVDRGLEVIERNARRQLALVEELIAAAEPDTSSEDWRRLDVRELVGTLLDALEPNAAAAQVRLAMDGPDSPAMAEAPSAGADSIWVWGDAPALRLALRHVLDNAVKYTPQGGEVKTRVRQCGDRVLIFVCDTGGGIEADRVEEIFEPFHQADSSAARRFGGLGLGLTIARKVIERHGGYIDLRGNGAAAGATVLITLPGAPPQNAA